VIAPSFPKAQYFVQRSELEEARWKGLSDPDSFLPEDYEPLREAGVLKEVDGNHKVFRWLELRWTGGHSVGHQLVVIGEPRGSLAIFPSDLIPTSTQLSVDSGMSYDENPGELRVAKEKILEEAADQHALLMFVHAPRARAGYVKKSGIGQLEFEKIEI
jgi:glyoxylase-like metal-dependent hydrolase (beta-lactamase superfamily II)